MLSCSQQKLYRTTFDKALATSCLNCQFSGSQKAPEKGPRVLPVPGKMATEAGAQASQAGRHPPSPLRPRPSPSTRLPGGAERGEGKGGGEGGAEAACRETWSGGRGAGPAGSSLPELYCTTSPQLPCLLPQAPPRRLCHRTSEHTLRIPGAPRGNEGDF